MIKNIKLSIVLLSAIILFACGSNDSANQSNGANQSTSSSSASIQGNAVKGPIEGAEIKLFYFSDNGTEAEIVAQNAPVLTSPSGGFEFKLNPDDLKNVQSPLLVRNTGGTMGGQPAPELETIISDPNPLKGAGQTITRHMSTASSVAAKMLRYRIQKDNLTPRPADAADCISKVEQALDVDLDQDPADAGQTVAMLNQNVDENLDLFTKPENNDIVTEYIDFLVCNLNSSSGMLDENMDNPDNPGEDVAAHFDGFGHGRLKKLFPDGPSGFLNLFVAVDKRSILADGVDAATLKLKLTDGWDRPIEREALIDLAIISGQGILSNTNPAALNGRAQVTFKSTTPGAALIQASYSLDNGNTIVQEIVVQVVDTAENASPIANAGSDQNVGTSSVVTLDGSQSSDLNDDILTYNWTLVSTPGGSAATLSDAGAINPTFTADVDGVYVAELVVNDGTVDSAPDTVTVTAASANSAPTANAGPDQNVATGSTATLNGSASSDADNDPLTYVWTLVSKPNGSSAALSDVTQSNPTFTADVDGVYVAELVVNDGTVDSAPDTVTVTAASANSAPTANAGPDQNVATGSTATLNGSASSDADNDPLTYVWTLVSKPSGSGAALSDVTQSNPTFTADTDGIYVLRLVVNDGTVNSAPDTVTVTAASANSAPTANAGPDQNVATGSTVTLNGSASSDADNDPLTYVWTLVSRPSGSSAALSNATASNSTFIADTDGNYVVRLVVNDGAVDSAPDTVTITGATANSAPTANAGPDQNVATGSTVTLNGSASSDADNDPLAYVWTLVSKPSGSGAALSNATASNPTFIADTDGNYVVRLVVNDGAVDSAPDTVTITGATANSAPTANAGPDQNVATGSTVTLNGSASSDADGDLLAYTWTMVSRPSGSGAALSNATASNPTFIADTDGNYVVGLVVNDGSVDSSPASVTITAAASGPNGQALFNDNCSRCHSSNSFRTITAAQIQNKLPHNGNTLSSLGGTAGIQAIANWLNSLN